VLTSKSGQQATFALRAGGEAAILGRGDLHEPGLERYRGVASAGLDGEQWRVELYPTRELIGTYLTAAPARNAAVIAVVVSACGGIFAWYELHVRRRAARLNGALRRNLAELSRMKGEESAAQARLHAAGLKQQDEFVSMVSHEIRTPLNAVGGASALLADTPLNSEQRELVALLEAGTAHVVLIIEARAAARRQRRGMRALSATDACTGRHRTS
jgi:signal transduction histidine kinase